MALKYSQFADRIDIDALEDAIAFEPIDRQNGEDRGYCPDFWGLHKNGDTTGKFSINREKRVYGCWVCGGGSLLSLIMEAKKLDEVAATDWLYQFASAGEQSSEGFLSEIDEMLAVEDRKDAVLPYFNDRVLDRWSSSAMDDHHWFDGRGITPNIVNSYNLGFDPDHRRASSKGEHTGPAIIFPHYWNDRLVGWQERWLEDRPRWLPKYTNTHDFPRKETIFNYERVYFSHRPIMVVESVPTVLFLAALELPAVATFGASITAGQLRLLRKCQQGLVLCPDNDGAGEKWLDTIVEALDRYVRLAEIDPVGDVGGDLGDLVGRSEEVKDLYYHAHTVL